MVVLDIKTGKIELIDNIYDFDWYTQENKLVLVKQAEHSPLKTTAMVYDPGNNQSMECRKRQRISRASPLTTAVTYM